MKRILFFLALVSLVGCKPNADKALELAQKEVAADTKDPDSAKFRYLRFVQKDDMPDGTVNGLVCGQLNAKNGFGAYAGFSPFMLEIRMKSKGFFSSKVTYSILGKRIYTEYNQPDLASYQKACGPDE